MFYFWLDYYDETSWGQTVKDYFLAMVAAHTGVTVSFLPLKMQGIDAERVPPHYQPIARRFGGVGGPLEGVLYAGALEDIERRSLGEAYASCAMFCPERELSAESVQKLNGYRQILTPTLRGASFLRAQGVQRVAAVPAPIDAPAWGKVPATRRSDQFIFYTVGSWGAPDNVKDVVQAYLELERDPRVCLHVVCPNNPIHGPAELMKLQPERVLEDLPFVAVDPRGFSALKRSRQEWMELHKQGHCYVSASTHPMLDLWGLGAAAAGNFLVGDEALTAALEGEDPALDVVQPTEGLAAAMRHVLETKPARRKIGAGRSLVSIGEQLAAALRVQ